MRKLVGKREENIGEKGPRKRPTHIYYVFVDVSQISDWELSRLTSGDGGGTVSGCLFTHYVEKPWLQ